MSEYFRKPIVKTLMLKGKDAVSISNIEKKSTSGLTDTYEITLTDGTKKSFNVSNGKGIKSIAKTSTSGLVDTYTTTYNDGTTTTFTVKNGEKGDTGSVENLEVGGVNILLNSNFDGTSNPRENWEQWGDYPFEIINNHNVNYLHVVTSLSYQGYQQTFDNSTFKNIKLANQQFTYSFIGYSPKEGEICQVGIHFLAENGDILSQEWCDFNLKTYPSKYHFTFKIPNDENIKGMKIMIGVGANSTDKNIYICKPKLEFGEIATDWTPSLEDIENESAKDILNKTYPIGSIYMSVNSTEPSTLFGGTWERLKGRFLIGAGAVTDTNSNTRFGSIGAEEPDFANGETGGQYLHKLNVDEMPEHSHVGNYYNGQNMSPNNGGSNPDGGYHYNWENGGSNSQNEAMFVASTGGGQEHNNMPPYLAVYMWKRTA